MKKSHLILSLLAIVSLAFFSCNRENVQDDEEANLAAEEQALNDDVVEDLTATSDEGVERFGQFGPGAFRGCATLTSSAPLGTYPNTITIDFGVNGCAGPGGRMYYGQMQIAISGPMNQAGSTRTITPVNLFVDSIAVTGSHVRTYNGLNASGQPNSTLVATHTLTFPDGSSATWSSTRTRTMIGGSSTPAILADDVYEISGSGQGVNRNGNSYSSTISSPLTIEYGCRWITSGVVQVTTPNGSRSLDYGAGSCDRLAVMTLPNGNTRNVVLRR